MNHSAGLWNSQAQIKEIIGNDEGVKREKGFIWVVLPSLPPKSPLVCFDLHYSGENGIGPSGIP